MAVPNENLIFEAGHLVAWNGRTLDLHNNFNFSGLEYSPEMATVLLRWSRCEGAWVSDGDPTRLTMAFTGVYLLRVEFSRENDAVGPTEATTLSYAGYLHADDTDTMDGYLEESEVSGASHTVLGFEGGMVVKIGALSASVSGDMAEAVLESSIRAIGGS